MWGGLVARAIRNAIRANRFTRIIRTRTPYFYSASGRFAQITRMSDSRESPDSRESYESIHANHATKWGGLRKGRFVILVFPLFYSILGLQHTQMLGKTARKMSLSHPFWGAQVLVIDPILPIYRSSIGSLFDEKSRIPLLGAR